MNDKIENAKLDLSIDELVLKNLKVAKNQTTSKKNIGELITIAKQNVKKSKKKLKDLEKVV